MRFIAQPDDAFRLGDFLKENLANREWREFMAAVAFVKRSGVKHVRTDLAAFAARGRIRVAVGVDCNGTSKEGLEDLLAAVPPPSELYVFHNELETTFHPKLYLFKNATSAVVAIGSGNLTEGGLFTNYEASVVLSLALQRAADQELLNKIEASLAAWMDAAKPTVQQLNPGVLNRLVEEGYVQSEARSMGDLPGVRAARGAGVAAGESLFGRAAVRRAPTTERTVVERTRRRRAGAPAPAAGEGFVMTLMQTDAGHGQTRAGTARRSPEIFIPLGARDFAPGFWGWPDRFVESATKWDREGVRMRIGAQVVVVNMMGWKLKHDLRLRAEALRSAGAVGDILRIVATDANVVGYDYDVEIIPRASPAYDSHSELCSHTTPNSEKRWGYF